MGNIISYLKWRGDISFQERAFCEVDNLILSELAYLDFSGIVPSPSEKGDITIEEAAGNYEQQNKTASVDAFPPTLIKALAVSRRFKKAKLSKFTDITDEAEQTQFSALHIKLEDGTVYIAFRGTSDEIIGWREDFSLSYQIMPAQRQAARYAEETMDKPNMKYRLGGHSKGGNLALYAALCCKSEKQEQIIQVYSNDGPGLCPDIINMSDYEKIRTKVVRIIPEFSLIGKLFEQDKADLIVKSSVSGAMAHDGFTWEVKGDRFTSCSKSSPESRFFNDVFDTWITSASMEQRKVFTKDFFDALEASGAKKISELTANGMDGMESIIVALLHSENRSKIMIFKFLRSLVSRIKSTNWKNALKTKGMVTGILLFIVGLIIIGNPIFAGKCIGIALCLTAAVLISKRLINCAVDQAADITKKKWTITFYLVVIGVIITLLNQIRIINGFVELMLSAAFLWLAYQEAKKALCKTCRKPLRILHGVITLLALLFGILPATVYALEITAYTVTAGTFILIYGISLIVKTIYRKQNDISAY